MQVPEHRPKKSLGQSFLINEHYAEIEAAHAAGKTVLEIGAGSGMLTGKLCEVAKKVIAVEIDAALYNELKRRIKADNLKLINGNFFSISAEALELKHIDIVIANVPYSLSSKTTEFLSENNLQAVLCLQKEFVEHMLAKPGTRNYSRLSVMSQLNFRITKIISVARGNFRPVPKVDSEIVYLKPIAHIDSETAKIIKALMQYKKKTIKNAVAYACKTLGMSDDKIKDAIAAAKPQGERLFKLSPHEVLELAEHIGSKVNKNQN